MKRKTIDYERTQGIAKIEISGSPRNWQKARVTMKEGGDQFVLDRKDCPKNVRPGVWYINASGNKTKLFSLRPVRGQFKGKVTKFAAQEGKPPVPKADSFGNVRFTAIITITEGKEKGLEVPVTMRYWFCPEQTEDGRTVVALEYHPKSTKSMPILEDFVVATGLAESTDQKPMPWKDNVLPMMEKRIQELGKVFTFSMRDGWVDSIYPPEDAGFSFGDSEDDEDYSDFTPEEE